MTGTSRLAHAKRRGARVLERIRTAPPWRRWWHELTRQDRKAVRRYALGMLWAAAFVAFTPAAVADVLDFSLRVGVPAGVVIGGGFAIFGRTTFRHLTWELRGVYLMVLGLLFYAVVEAVIAFTLEVPAGHMDRVALVILACWITSEVSDRLEYLTRELVRRLRRDDKTARVEEER